MKGFALEIDVSALTVFLQGILSFFSPCVLPLLPVYFGYLSGGTAKKTEDGTWVYPRKTVFVNTCFFVLGVGFSFLLLGLGMSALGRFFSLRQRLFTTIGGVIIILFGLFQVGLLEKIPWIGQILNRDGRVSGRMRQGAMSPFSALVMGFFFSFGWTPCIGPTLSSVLILAASAGSQARGMALIGVYTLGFVLPFLVAGLFTASLLGLLKAHRGIMTYTRLVGGILLIFMGIFMISGKLNAWSGFLAGL